MVTSYLARLLPAGNELHLWFEPGRIYLRLMTPWLRAPLDLVLAPELSGGQLQADIVDLCIGSYHFSSWQKAIAQDILNDLLQDTLSGFALTSLVLDEGSIAISGAVS